MSDLQKNNRSSIMKAVKSFGNKSTELRLIQIFKRFHITGWRRKYKLIGKPDFVFPDKHIAIFADGCFWHGHMCRNVTPKDNAAYWSKKIIKNRTRDAYITRCLEEKGWCVIRVWECEIKKDSLPDKLRALCS
ncbi:MAG: DNA mismatch endonuclease Vsr [Nitrospirae bacterium]|nr:DNA mismatch endonuclease Vsr [Nitrospirota bacterium]